MAGQKGSAAKGGRAGKNAAAGGGGRVSNRMASVASPALMVSVEEAMARLGIGRKSVYRLINSGDLFSKTVGRRRLIPVWALETFAGLPRSA